MTARQMDRFTAACGLADPLELSVLGSSQGRERLQLDGPFAVVGPDARSPVRLGPESAASYRFYFQALQGRVLSVELPVQDSPTSRSAALRAGWVDPEQPIQVGSLLLDVHTHALAGVPAAPRNPLHDRVTDPRWITPVVLEVVVPGAEQRWNVNRVLTLVGSATECRVRLRDPNVSRFHCALVGTPDGMWIVDLWSRTGTWLNGERVDWSSVSHGDEVEVGDFRLQFTYQSLGPVAAPPHLALAPSGPSLLPVSLPGGLWSAGPELQPGSIPSAVVPFVHQVQALHQQMFGQFQQAFMAMAEMFLTLHRDQASAFREEVEQFRRVSAEVEALRLELRGHLADPSPLEQISEQAPPTPAANESPLADPLGIQGEGPTGIPTRQRGSVACDNDSEPVHDDGEGSSEPGPAPRPATDVGVEVHDWLCGRMMALERERQTRWQKLVGALLGK
jgi:hypothetical protein